MTSRKHGPTLRQIEQLAARYNAAVGSPTTYGPGFHFIHHLAGSGYCLVQVCADLRQVEDVFGCGHTSRDDLAARLQSRLRMLVPVSANQS